MREIKYIVIHCTGSLAMQSTAEIKAYWRNVNKWKTVGYHYIISVDGRFEQLSPIESPTNGVKGFNQHSIHICYKGGLGGVDTRTEEQKETLKMLVKQMAKRFPKAEIKGHRDFLTKGKSGWKECPSFDVSEWIKEINL